MVVHAAGATISSTSGNTFAITDRGSANFIGGNIVASGTQATAIDCRTLDNVDTPSVLLDDVSVSSSHDGLNLIQCNGTVKQSRVRVAPSGGTAVAGVQQSIVNIDRSELTGEAAGILGGDSGTIVTVRNSTIDLATPGGDAFFVVNDAAALVSFTTIVNGKVESPNGTPVCTGSNPVSVCIDNSIIANFATNAPANDVTGSLCSVSYSIIYPQSTSIGTGNKLNVDPKLKDPANGDYHLLVGSPAIDASSPGATDAVDFDGKARDSKPDLGAFEF